MIRLSDLHQSVYKLGLHESAFRFSLNNTHQHKFIFYKSFGKPPSFSSVIYKSTWLLQVHTLVDVSNLRDCAPCHAWTNIGQPASMLDVCLAILIQYNRITPYYSVRYLILTSFFTLSLIKTPTRHLNVAKHQTSHFS